MPSAGIAGAAPVWQNENTQSTYLFVFQGVMFVDAPADTPLPATNSRSGSSSLAGTPVSHSLPEIVTSSPVTGTKETARQWGLTRSDQFFVGVLVVAATVLLAGYWVRISRFGTRPIEIRHLPDRVYDYRLDINRAEWVEWALLEGIGETIAKRIVEDRTANGPFTSIDDLRRVKGIGEKTLERIRPWLTVGSAAPFASQ